MIAVLKIRTKLLGYAEQLHTEFSRLGDHTTGAEYRAFVEGRKKLIEGFQRLADRLPAASQGSGSVASAIDGDDQLQAILGHLDFAQSKNHTALDEFTRLEADRDQLIEDLKMLLHRTRKANQGPRKSVQLTARLLAFADELGDEFGELKHHTTPAEYQRFEGRRRKLIASLQALLNRMKANRGASENDRIAMPVAGDQERLREFAEELRLEFGQPRKSVALAEAEYEFFEEGTRNLTEDLKELLHRVRKTNQAPQRPEAEAEPFKGPSKVRRLCLAEMFSDIESLEVPIGAINELGGHPNKVDLLFVAAIAAYRKAKRIFEFGTYTGRTTYHLARATPESRVWTLNMPPEDDPRVAPFLGTHFKGTEAASRITQLFSDSRKFDTAPYKGTMDFIFVDADHSYDLVKNDTEKAVEMLAPGGMIIWHDFAVKSPGVMRFVQEFSIDKPVFHIRTTCLAVYIDGVDAMGFAAHPLRPSLEAEILKRDEDAFG